MGRCTLNESNKRGYWLKQWVMSQRLVALNTMYRKQADKQTTFRSANGKEKQLDYTLTSRRHLKFSKDAEENDMLHMASDHRSVLAQFVIPAKDWKGSQAKHRKSNKLTDPMEGNGLSERVEISTFEERYRELERKVLKVKDPATKTEHPEQEIVPEQKRKRATAAARQKT